MKKLVSIALMSLLSMSFTFAQESLKNEVAESVKGFISDSKSIISGITEGITEGRAEGESTDRAIIIKDHTSMVEHIAFSVSKVKVLSGDRYELTLAFKNSADRPVRLIELDQDQNVLLIDQEGFASHLASNMFSSSRDDITIPANAGVRVQWIFDNVEDKPKTLRFYHHDYLLESLEK